VARASFTVSGVDARGCPQSGATTAAAAYERALAAFQGWRVGAEAELAPALQEAPGFVMAHVLEGYLRVSSRDPRRVRSAGPMLAHAAALPMNWRERLHVAALRAVLADDYEGAKARLGKLLRREPRDVLALQMAHSFDYLTGDVARLHDRVAAVLPAWSRDLPGYSAVLAMHAFGLEESGEYEHAEQGARAALALDPHNARAHHAMAHVFEMTGRAEAGVRWMKENADGWAAGSIVVRHCFWHLALFHLACGEVDEALALYDERICPGSHAGVADLIDASALLWRLHLRGVNPGARWRVVADAWAPFSDDAFCSFNDLHAMLAFVGAGDRERAGHLEQVLAAGRALRTRHGEMTRRLGLKACRAVIAFGAGDDPLAIRLLARLPPRALRLGGSHAQRDVLPLTGLRALARIGQLRRPDRLHIAMARFNRALGLLLPGVRRRHTLAPEWPS
jgi:tetratricopeptide (TPR) repeat protein